MAATVQTFTFEKNVHVSAGTTRFPATGGFSVSAGNLAAIIDNAGDPTGISYSMEVDESTDGGTTWTVWDVENLTTDPGIAKGNFTATQHAVGGQWGGGLMSVTVTATAALSLTVSGELVT